MSHSDRLALALETGALALPADGAVVVLRAEPSRFLDLVPPGRLRCVQTFRPLHDALAARGYAVSTRAEGPAAMVVVMLTRSRAESLGNIARGLEILDPGGTLAVNIVVVLYERRAARRLNSEVLAADAHHTASDLATSLTVIAALIGVRLGYAWLDPAAALVVAGFIAYACWEIFADTSNILGDRMVIDESRIREVVKEIPEVVDCHHIRTRGSADYVFLDLHVWLDGALPLDEAHRLSHVVKDRLMARFPEIKDAVIHIEPTPAHGST